MFSRIATFVVFLSVAALTACGGGSSSGGSQGGPAPTAFAGRYEGAFSVSFQGQTDSTPAVITVDSMGLVNIELPGAAEAACVIDPTPGTPFLVGNRIAFDVTGTCFEPSLGGTCDVRMAGEVVFSTTSAVGNGPFNVKCPAGNFDVTWGIGANKV